MPPVPFNRTLSDGNSPQTEKQSLPRAPQSPAAEDAEEEVTGPYSVAPTIMRFSSRSDGAMVAVRFQPTVSKSPHIAVRRVATIETVNVTHSSQCSHAEMI